MPENAEYQPWMDSPWVSTLVDYENDVEEVIDTSKIAWFDVKMDLAETEQEKKEKIQAMQEQIRMGILQPNGYPVGMQVPQGMHVVGSQEARGGFNFPGAIGMPLPAKFGATPVTRHLQAAANAIPTKLPKTIPGILPDFPVPQKAQDRNVFDKGNEKLRRIQELTRDRRK